jgi:hypothetical protein
MNRKLIVVEQEGMVIIFRRALKGTVQCISGSCLRAVTLTIGTIEGTTFWSKKSESENRMIYANAFVVFKYSAVWFTWKHSMKSDKIWQLRHTVKWL